MRRGKRGYDRTQRVGDLIQQTLAQIILQDMSDERFRHVTVTGVNVSRDLSYAKVFISVLTEEPDQIKDVLDALNKASKSFRYQVAQAVKLRIAPELKFVYDESTAHGFHISDLIDSAMKKISE